MARPTEFLILQMVFLCCVLLARAEKVMRPKFKDINLWSDNKFVKHSITFDPNDPHVNFTLDVLEEVHDVDLHWEGFVMKKDDPNYYFAANSTVNLCRILNWRAQSPIGTLIHAYLKEYGNILESCPIAKGQYFMHKFWIPEDTASATIPEISFDIKFSAYHLDASHKRTLVINDHITGEGVVMDVNNVKRGILAMLPKAG